MASITKSGLTYRVQISIAGVRDSATFSTKAKAQAWAAMRETELRAQKETGILAGKTCAQAFTRYGEEVSPKKDGERWELLRLAAFTRHFGDLPLIDLTPDIIGKWREERLKTVKGSTVNRDLNVLSNVLSIACSEWRWVASRATKNVKRPKDSPPRDRRVTEKEIEKLNLVLGFDETKAITMNQRVAIAFLFAIETAMRAGEICGLRPGWIDGAVVHLPAVINKNDVKRDVPLSKRALFLLGLLPAELFDMKSASLDALFRKARKKAGIEGLTFHDSRHEAITRLSAKLDVLELARMVGHRDLKMLMVYYNKSAADIAKRLD